ncbi:hypothetical protein PsorP6_009997 [Peronosclerospora sorghi]|uniref:Uncharacterized protein n=1 Tax=Peronosclerospora sorghi TaxID=230839 RepID=A0ACC0VUI1_9STRA|nr:hypothetical protein PsorP6_009997 [Peronosclerospora sorghi]
MQTRISCEFQENDQQQHYAFTSLRSVQTDPYTKCGACAESSCDTQNCIPSAVMLQPRYSTN